MWKMQVCKCFKHLNYYSRVKVEARWRAERMQRHANDRALERDSSACQRKMHVLCVKKNLDIRNKCKAM